MQFTSASSPPSPRPPAPISYLRGWFAPGGVFSSVSRRLLSSIGRLRASTPVGGSPLVAFLLLSSACAVGDPLPPGWSPTFTMPATEFRDASPQTFTYFSTGAAPQDSGYGLVNEYASASGPWLYELVNNAWPDSIATGTDGFTEGPWVFSAYNFDTGAFEQGLLLTHSADPLTTGMIAAGAVYLTFDGVAPIDAPTSDEFQNQFDLGRDGGVVITGNELAGVVPEPSYNGPALVMGGASVLCLFGRALQAMTGKA